jgi:hypothetical protein
LGRRKKKDVRTTHGRSLYVERIKAGEIVTEIAMTFGWTLDYILNMPAKHLFVTLKHGRDLEYRKRQENYIDLCNVSQCAIGDVNYNKEIKKFYYDKIKNTKYDKHGRNVLESGDPKSATILASLLGQKGF